MIKAQNIRRKNLGLGHFLLRSNKCAVFVSTPKLFKFPMTSWGLNSEETNTWLDKNCLWNKLAEGSFLDQVTESVCWFRVGEFYHMFVGVWPVKSPKTNLVSFRVLLFVLKDRIPNKKSKAVQKAVILFISHETWYILFSGNACLSSNKEKTTCISMVVTMSRLSGTMAPCFGQQEVDEWCWKVAHGS